MKEIKRKTVLITGGSRGIGAAIAKRFADADYRVAICFSKSYEEAKNLIDSLHGDDGKHIAVKCDVTKEADVENLKCEIKKQFGGRLNVLVNNAAFTKFISHDDLDALEIDLFDKIYETNLRGAFLCARKLSPLLKSTGDGLIINISSIAANTAVGSNIAYCAMKAALNNMTKSLARALAPKVRVVSVSPGLIDTDFTKGFGGYRDEQIEKNPLKRLGKVSDIAECVISLATSLNYINGTDIVVDGGRQIN